MPKGHYIRKPRKPAVEQQEAKAAVEPKLTHAAVAAFNVALNRLALGRDYLATIATGKEDRKDVPGLAEEAKAAIDDAGQKLELALVEAGLTDGIGGWFLVAPKPEKVATQ